MVKVKSRETVAVLGLGRFGTAVAETLLALGHEVIGLDGDAAIVQHLSDEMPHIVQADTTEPDVLRELGIADVDHAFVAIGSDIEASVLTVLALQEIGVKDIWAKATQKRHGVILKRIGVSHLVYPESDTGRRTAHLLNGSMSDYFELADGFAVGATRVPAAAAGVSLAEAKLRQRFGVTVIGTRKDGAQFSYAEAGTILEAGDQVIVTGDAAKVRAFAAME